MSEIESLKKLLLDSDLFDSLKEYTNDINIFDILKIENAELKHSVVLSYIFNPNESHGLDTKPLELFFQKLAIENNIKQLNLFDLLDINYKDFNIIREYKNIDILMKSSQNKIVICIENKIWSDEHDNQLVRYKKIIDEEFNGYKKIFIYLTPNGYESSDKKNWYNLSYIDIVEIIESLDVENLNDKVRMLINDYTLLIRRKLMNDYELKELCNKIYKKHKKALDLIWENKEDEIYYIYNIINDYLKERNDSGIINYSEINSSRTYLRFTTEDLEKNFPLLEESKSSWRNKNTVFYEIIISKTKIRVQISFGYKGLNRNKRYEEAQKFLKKIGLKRTTYKESVGYITKNLQGIIKLDKITMEEEEDVEYIYQKLDELLKPIL